MPARYGVKNLHVNNKSSPDIMMLAFSHAKHQFWNPERVYANAVVKNSYMGFLHNQINLISLTHSMAI